jgi:serine/threonine-protein kinase
MTIIESTLLKKGDVINNTYVIECFIGNGTFGDVYRVNHKFLGIQVLKVLKKEFVDNTDLKTMNDEALILSRLTHKNIVRVFEANRFQLNNTSYHFITMEFISGESLNQLMRRKISLSVASCLSIQIEILKALAEVHNQTPLLIHRDISPDNILLCYRNEKPRVLLSDFGLAQSVDQLSGISSAAGKYIYFAPECFWGVYLPASDVFSSAIVLYKMLTGLFPWNYDFDEIDGDNLEATRKTIVQNRKKTIKPPSFYNEECSKNLDRIVMKALSKELEGRYLNGQSFLDDTLQELQRCLSNELFTKNEMHSYFKLNK